MFPTTCIRVLWYVLLLIFLRLDWCPPYGIFCYLFVLLGICMGLWFVGSSCMIDPPLSLCAWWAMHSWRHAVTAQDVLCVSSCMSWPSTWKCAYACCVFMHTTGRAYGTNTCSLTYASHKTFHKWTCVSVLTSFFGIAWLVLRLICIFVLSIFQGWAVLALSFFPSVLDMSWISPLRPRDLGTQRDASTWGER